MKLKKLGFTLYCTLYILSSFGQPEKGKPGSVESYKVQEYYNVLASDNTVIEGPYELWYKGVKVVSGNFSNNEKTGLWKFTNLSVPFKNKNGVIVDSLSRDIYYQGFYQNDKKNGIWKYYLNKKPLCTIYYKDNLRDSIWKSFYPNGQVRIIINYIEGVQNGLYEQFAPDGKKLVSKEYLNDVLNGNYILYNVSGGVRVHIVYKQGIPFNVLALNDRLDNKLDPGTLKDGNGTLKYYDEKERVSLLETYKDGLKDGVFEKYYASTGKISEKGTFTKGVQNDDWIYLKADGKAEKTIVQNNISVERDTVKKKMTGDFITSFTEIRPQPQGGDEEFQAYLESNINYFKFDDGLDFNKTASKYALPASQTKSKLKFVVSATGKAYHVEFGNGFDKDSEATIKQAFQAMPPWVPGFDLGFPVEYYYTMPIIIVK